MVSYWDSLMIKCTIMLQVSQVYFIFVLRIPFIHVFTYKHILGKIYDKLTHVCNPSLYCSVWNSLRILILKMKSIKTAMHLCFSSKFGCHYVTLWYPNLLEIGTDRLDWCYGKLTAQWINWYTEIGRPKSLKSCVQVWNDRQFVKFVFMQKWTIQRLKTVRTE